MLLLASSGSISLLGGMGGMVQNVKGGGELLGNCSRLSQCEFRKKITSVFGKSEFGKIAEFAY
jgi:hypothetical protein